MYSICREKHYKYGNVIIINREEEDVGTYLSPFIAANQAINMRQLWLQEGEIKVRILVDNQVMTVSQVRQWSNEEYKNLPKCKGCAHILGGQVYTHQLCSSGFFCSQSCADKSYAQDIEKINDEEEIDFRS